MKQNLKSFGTALSREEAKKILGGYGIWRNVLLAKM